MDKPKLTIRNHGAFSLEGFRGTNPLPTLNRTIDLLNANLTAPYHLSAGTALGIHRDGMFILHDTDLDISVILPWEGDHYDLALGLVRAFAHANIPLVRSIIAGRKPIQLVFSDLENHGTLIDVEMYFTGITEGKAVHYKPEGYITLPVFSVRPRAFCGLTVPMPDPIEDYLEYRYGDWKTPTTMKGAWQEYTKALTLWNS